MSKPPPSRKPRCGAPPQKPQATMLSSRCLYSAWGGSAATNGGVQAGPLSCLPGGGPGLSLGQGVAELAASKVRLVTQLLLDPGGQQNQEWALSGESAPPNPFPRLGPAEQPGPASSRLRPQSPRIWAYFSPGPAPPDQAPPPPVPEELVVLGQALGAAGGARLNLRTAGKELRGRGLGWALSGRGQGRGTHSTQGPRRAGPIRVVEGWCRGRI